ncbi:hypothetical protein ACFLYU_02345 [Candidatus Dependentiae bacterium]
MRISRLSFLFLFSMGIALQPGLFGEPPTAPSTKSTTASSTPTEYGPKVSSSVGKKTSPSPVSKASSSVGKKASPSPAPKALPSTNKNAKDKKPEISRQAQDDREKKPKQDKKKVAKDVKETSEVEKEVAIKGLDTVSVREPEGNWLLKRIWWEKAQKKYEKIKTFVSKILESRMAFFDKRNDLEKNVLNPFYSEIGLKEGALIDTIQTLLDVLNKAQQEGVIPSGDKEKEFADTLKLEENNLKQLDADMKGILDLDSSIDQDIDKLSQQINRSRRYEDNAWQLFKAIAKELSHKKARELYYKMDALWKNVKGIDNYIKGAFSRHFDSIIEDAKTNVDRIKKIAKEFKDKGIDLKKQYQELVNPLRQAQDDRVEAPEVAIPVQVDKEQEVSKEKLDQEDLEESTDVGWIGTIWNIITWPFRKVWGAISSLLS